MKNLLPPNSTELERKVAEELGNNSNLPANLRSLVTLNDVPSQFLPHLAWENSVDRWQQDWPEEVKKQQIKASFEVHKYKGTNYSLRKIVEAFGYSVTIYEWWQEVPMNEPGTFQITIETNGRSLTEKTSKTLVELLYDAKPLTRELKGIEINVINVKGETNVACACYCGEDITIYPKVDDPQSMIYPFFSFYEHELTSVYPK